MSPPPLSPPPLVTRFAPSPTGALHLGHAYSALVAHDRARAAGGRFLLRIEDIDAARCRPAYETAILDDLAWLGVAWDAPPLRQSDRLDVYAARLADLAERGLAYRCFRTRREVEAAMSAAHGPPSAFAGGRLPAAEEAARMASGEPFAWRLDLEAAQAAAGPVRVRIETDGAAHTRPAAPEAHGDAVLGRKDVGTSYHLAATTDDAASGITHVIRGEDLADAADLHALLHALFGETAPTYVHHRLITDESGRRLAKRDRARTLAALREDGVTPSAIRAQLGLGPAPPPSGRPA